MRRHFLTDAAKAQVPGGAVLRPVGVPRLPDRCDSCGGRRGLTGPPATTAARPWIRDRRRRLQVLAACTPGAASVVPHHPAGTANGLHNRRQPRHLKSAVWTGATKTVWCCGSGPL